MSIKNDKAIIQELGRQIKQIADLDVQQKRLKEWKAHNSLNQIRPMFIVDQLCWNEMAIGDELTLKCKDAFSQKIEQDLRRRLYKWNHVRDDNVVEPFVYVNKTISGNGLGIDIDEEILTTDEENSIVSHQYHDKLKTVQDLDRIKIPNIKYHKKATEMEMEKTQELLGDTLKVRALGVSVNLSLWDVISRYRGVEPILYDIMDRPAFVHSIIEKFVDFTNTLVDQLEELGLIAPAQSLIHCSGAWCDELPKENFNPEKPRACDSWTMGKAQLFATVSPKTHDELEIEHQKALYERFGLVNYGCCEPLDRKIDMIRKINNVRKISMSPWANQSRGAEAMGNDYIFLRKPNPALVVGNVDDDIIRKDLEETLAICKEFNAIPEFILKDISTVGYNPKNLWRWADIARDIFGG